MKKSSSTSDQTAASRPPSAWPSAVAAPISPSSSRIGQAKIAKRFADADQHCRG